MLKKNSLGMFDLIKGIFMILVISLHTLTIYFKYWDIELSFSPKGLGVLLLKLVVYSVIPAFFMISGYTFRKRSLKKTVKDNCKYILKPYMVAGLVTSVAIGGKSLILGEDSLSQTIGAFGAFVLGLCPGYVNKAGIEFIGIGPSWFLVSLFVGTLLLSLLLKLESTLVEGIVLLTALSFITRLGFHSFIPFCIIQAVVCMSYLYIGKEIKAEGLLLRKFKPIEWIILLVVVAAVAPFGFFEVSQNVWRLGMLDYALSVACGILCTKLLLELNRFENKLTDGIREVGRRSLNILCVHTVEYCVIPWQEIFDSTGLPTAAKIVLILICRSMFVALGVMLVDFVNEKIKKSKYEGK